MTARARATLRVVLTLAVLGACARPAPGLTLGFSQLYCPLANLFLTGHSFGERGHASLIPLTAIDRREGDSVTADAMLALTVDGYQGRLPLGISLRRDVYLPMLLASAVIALAALPLARRLLCLAIAVSITLAAGIAANALVVAWTFATQVRGLYPSGAAPRRFLELACSALLSPPGNRFIAPILLGVGLVLWQRLRPPARRPRDCSDPAAGAG